MKKLRTCSLFAAAAVSGALVFGSLAYGQDAAVTTGTASAAAPTSPTEPGHKGHGGRLEKLAEALSLTDAQKEQIKPNPEERVRADEGIKDDTSVPDDQKKEKAKAVHKASNEQINALLTPEQQQKWKEMMEARRAKHGAGQPATTGTNQ